MTNKKNVFLSVLGMYLTNQAVLALIATDRATGLVLNSGHGATFTVPIYKVYSSHSFLN